jgi:DeoD family purine-nucleoside phosphorylase
VIIHLHPTAPLAERVLLPGDPGRALLLAQTLLEKPVMFNHHRGLWGYTGTAADGEPMTVQSTGMGGPSAAIVIAELAELGARRLLRVGTCGALQSSLALGDLVIAEEAIAEDGTSRALGAAGRAAPDRELLASLRGVAVAHGDDGAARIHCGAVVSSDLFYDGPAGAEERWIAAGALAVEMEVATLFALAARRGLAAGAVLLVSDLVRPRARIGEERLRAGEATLGSVAAAALMAPSAVADPVAPGR